MALYLLPVKPSVPSQRFTTTLDGRRFVFRFWWNQRTARWLFDLETDSGVSIVRCKGIVAGADALRQVRARPEAPQGVLTALGDTDPTFGSIVVGYFTD